MRPKNLVFTALLIFFPTVASAFGPLFDTSLTYEVGRGPTSVVAADLDGDGDLDLVTANWGDWYELNNTVSILKNNGDGTFAAKVDYETSFGPRSVFAADLDGDGDKDLATANYTNDSPPGHTVSILKNNGDGTFAISVDYEAGNYLIFVFAADIDGDGDLDLAIANDFSDSISVLKNTGDGTFAIRIVYPVEYAPSSVLASDLDEDGDIDLVTTNTANVSVLKNNGDGTFGPKDNYPTGNFPASVFAADLDNDGDKDLAVVNAEYWFYGLNSTISVLNNNGDGTFSTKVDYSAEGSPVSVFASDLDNDGDLDLVATNYGCCDYGIPECPGEGNTISVLTNNGDGTFVPKTDYRVGVSPASVVAFDLNGDGDEDLAVANHGCGSGNSLSLLSNTGCYNKAGDLNHDCFLTTVDVVLELNCIFLDLSNCNFNSTDVNCDGNITPADVVLLLLAVFASQPLPCP